MSGKFVKRHPYSPYDLFDRQLGVEPLVGAAVQATHEILGIDWRTTHLVPITRVRKGIDRTGPYRDLEMPRVGDITLQQYLIDLSNEDFSQKADITKRKQIAIVVNILINIAEGLDFLHQGLEPKVAYRDLHDRNVVVSNPSTDGLRQSTIVDYGYVELGVSRLCEYETSQYVGMIKLATSSLHLAKLICEDLWDTMKSRCDSWEYDYDQSRVDETGLTWIELAYQLLTPLLEFCEPQES